MADGEYRAPVGTLDVLPPDSGRWQTLVACFASRPPPLRLRARRHPRRRAPRGVPAGRRATDVVGKEMYDFADRAAGLALRPEATAPVVRAFVAAPPACRRGRSGTSRQFRYEKPQRGRYRQHCQSASRCSGRRPRRRRRGHRARWDGFYGVGLRRTSPAAELDGRRRDRAAYAARLRGYLLAHADDARPGDRDARRQQSAAGPRLEAPDSSDVHRRTPQLAEHLGDRRAPHFERVQAGLDRRHRRSRSTPRLVRGLDYYSRTTFEFVSDAIDAAQNAIGGGGRYDGLVEEMGGPPTPGIGFGVGVERRAARLRRRGRARAAPARASTCSSSTGSAATAPPRCSRRAPPRRRRARTAPTADGP